MAELGQEIEFIQIVGDLMEHFFEGHWYINPNE